MTILIFNGQCKFSLTFDIYEYIFSVLYLKGSSDMTLFILQVLNISVAFLTFQD